MAGAQSRAAGPNLILNFPPRCSNAVNSGVAIRGQRADQGNIKFDSITNSKVPIPSHPSLKRGGGGFLQLLRQNKIFCSVHDDFHPNNENHDQF